MDGLGPSERQRRRLGLGLIAYGLSGIAVAIVVVLAAAIAWDAIGRAGGTLERGRVNLIATLGTTAETLDLLAIAIDQAEGGLVGAADLSDKVAGLSRTIADSSKALADALGFEVFGQRPLAPLQPLFIDLARQTGEITADLEAIAVSLTKIADSSGPLQSSVTRLADRLEAINASLTALGPFDEARGSFIVLAAGLALLLSWLLMPAIIAIAVGLSLRRPRPASATSA